MFEWYLPVISRRFMRYPITKISQPLRSQTSSTDNRGTLPWTFYVIFGIVANISSLTSKLTNPFSNSLKWWNRVRQTTLHLSLTKQLWLVAMHKIKRIYLHLPERSSLMALGMQIEYLENDGKITTYIFLTSEMRSGWQKKLCTLRQCNKQRSFLFAPTFQIT